MFFVIWIKMGESDGTAGTLVLYRRTSQWRDLKTNANFGAERGLVCYFHDDHCQDEV
jgi:hypothetical protein